MTDTSIEWCRRPGTRAKTWNPTNGCLEISPGCLHCYAKTFAARFCGPGHRYEGLVERRGKGKLPMWTGELRFEEHMLGAPLHWRDPCTVFVNSMSDLFMFPPEVIAAVFGVAAACRDHTFIFLTKRAEELPRWFEWLDNPRDEEKVHALVDHAARALDRHDGAGVAEWRARLLARIGDQLVWPLPNVWIGVTCEDRKHGLPRLEHLRRVPAAVRLVSFEPLLEDLGEVDLTGIHWSIVGCESGPGARPFDEAWAVSLHEQSRRAGAAFFLKQARASFNVHAGDGSKIKPGGVIGAPYLRDEDGVPRQYLQFPAPRSS